MKMRIVSIALAVSALTVTPARSAEFAFTSYGLGSTAFSAGVTPPAGTYVTHVSAYYEGKIEGPVTIGRTVLDVATEAKFFSQAVNVLYVPERKVLGGNFGASITVPVGHIEIGAQVTGPLGNTVEQSVAGAGLGDISGRLQLGWMPHAAFAHTIYVQTVAPTGRYDANGLQPNIGLNRPGIDTGWGFTWTIPSAKLQINGAVGVTFNFENTATDYQSGIDFHAEWAIGYEICKGVLIGPAGYSYRQLTGDSGSGALLGAFQGEVDAIGAAVSYTTVVGTTPVILNARHYEEFNADKRMDGRMSILSATMKF